MPINVFFLCVLFITFSYNARRSKIRWENKKTATCNGEKTQFHCCERISQILINRPHISDSSSPLTGVVNISQVVGPDTGEQSPMEGRAITQKNESSFRGEGEGDLTTRL